MIASQAACCQVGVCTDDKPEAGLTFGRYLWFEAANTVAVTSAEVPDAGADAAFNLRFIFIRHVNVLQHEPALPVTSLQAAAPEMSLTAKEIGAKDSPLQTWD